MTIPAPAVLSISKNGAGTGGLLLQARDLQVTAPGEPASVSDISLHIQPGELVILSGGSQPARSLLLRALAGLIKPSGGDILLDGVDLYPYRKLFAAYIGYVPADLDLPESLTVQEALRHMAHLRLPRGTAKSLRLQRVTDLLDILGLQPVARTRLDRLDRFQRHLVSVAVELVSAPRLLLIEEPAVGLDPAEEVRLTRLLKALGRQGPTILQAAGATRCAQIADKLLVLAPNGELAWFGPGDEGLAYFRSLTPRERVPTGSAPGAAFGLEDAQETLASQSPANGATWSKGFQALPAFATYVDDPLNDRHPDLLLEDRPLSRFRGAAKEKTPPPRMPSVSGITRFSLLVGRSYRQLARSRTGLALLLAPPLVALLDFALSSPTMNDPGLGDPGHAPVALGLVVFLVMLVAALLFSNEITRERTVYRRERRTVSLAGPYALSKAWLVLLAAVYAGLVWAVVHTFAAGFANTLPLLVANWITLALVALVGGLLGLAASVLARARGAAVVLALALVVPQLVLSGSVLPQSQLPALARVASAGIPARYAFESLLTLSGYGADVAGDSCWQLPADKRNGLTPAQKSSCACTGDNLVSQCSFPGIHQFFTFVIEQPMPVAPIPATGGSSLPQPPVLADGEDKGDYAKAVNDYAAQVQQLHQQDSSYSASLEQYSSALTSWLGTRSEEIGQAEGLIALAVARYGQAFQANILQDWMLLGGISFLLLLILIGLQMTRGAST